MCGCGCADENIFQRSLNAKKFTEFSCVNINNGCASAVSTIVRVFLCVINTSIDMNPITFVSYEFATAHRPCTASSRHANNPRKRQRTAEKQTDKSIDDTCTTTTASSAFTIDGEEGQQRAADTNNANASAVERELNEWFTMETMQAFVNSMQGNIRDYVNEKVRCEKVLKDQVRELHRALNDKDVTLHERNERIIKLSRELDAERQESQANLLVIEVKDAIIHECNETISNLTSELEAEQRKSRARQVAIDDMKRAMSQVQRIFARDDDHDVANIAVDSQSTTDVSMPEKRVTTLACGDARLVDGVIARPLSNASCGDVDSNDDTDESDAEDDNDEYPMIVVDDSEVVNSSTVSGALVVSGDGLDVGELCGVRVNGERGVFSSDEEIDAGSPISNSSDGTNDVQLQPRIDSCESNSRCNTKHL